MSTVDSRYVINGLIKTDNDALSNLEKLADAAGCWVTYDTHEGKFAVVMNTAGTSQFSFDNSNIIGSLTIACTPLDKLYNTVKVSFPHEDLKGQNDWVQVAIPPADRLATEFDNMLSLDYGVVTNPVQAQLLGFIELKQSRVDKVVTFKTDYSKLGVKAGDLIDITNDIYGWTAKMFRVISVSESDLDDGAIEISITALEYDPTVYDEDLTRYVRSDSSGIISLSSLPAPTKPVIVTHEVAVRPTVDITTSIIAGIVESIEIWVSPDVTVADNQRSYSLLKDVTPVTLALSTNVIPINTPLVVEVDTLSASKFVVKARSKNKDGVSVFSLPSDTTTYNPVVTVSESGITESKIQREIDFITSSVSFAVVTAAYNVHAGSSSGGPVGIYGWETAYTIGYPGNVLSSCFMNITLTKDYSHMLINATVPLGTYAVNVKINGVVELRGPQGVRSYLPSSYYLLYNGLPIQSFTADWATQNVSTVVMSPKAGLYTILMAPLQTFDFTCEDTHIIFPFNFTVEPNMQGAGASLMATCYS